MIGRQSSVLDLGCGTGELLYVLIREKGVRGQGIEIDEQAIYRCVEKGLKRHSTATWTAAFPNLPRPVIRLVILNQTLQQVRHLKTVLDDSHRVGKKVIVASPISPTSRPAPAFLPGRTPVTPSYPFPCTRRRTCIS